MSADDRSSPFRGVSRRKFLQYCAFLCAVVGAGEVAVPEMALALAKLAKRPNVVWSCFGECLGCSVSLLQNSSPDIPHLVLQQISLDYHEAVMAAAGVQAEKALADVVSSGDFYWVAEGGIPTKPPEACTIGGRTAGEIATEIYKNAKASIATGNCATNGNVQASAPNPTGTMGVRDWLRTHGTPGATMIQMARCPGNGEDLVAALAYVLLYGKAPELDADGRPVFLYGQTVHENCERRAHFENGEFVETYGDAGSQQGWCLFKIGCKGPVTHAPCPKTRWNQRVSWCVHNGPCTGCAETGFWDRFTPFDRPLEGIELPGIGGVSAPTIGVAVAGAAAGGLAAHAVGQVATGRFGHGGPPESAGPGPGSGGSGNAAAGTPAANVMKGGDAS